MSDLQEPAPRWDAYRLGQHPLPDHILSWPYCGAGLENLGADGRPVREPFPSCGPDELLVRVDALGICASDAKMVTMGDQYPLFFERDFRRDPGRLGHEVALTVIQVGETWQGRYFVGQRLGLQPNIFAEGKRLIFGVNLPGGMTQYLTLGKEVLTDNHGSYVFPVPSQVTYVETALLEPWSCVEANYAQSRRVEPKRNGVMWIKGQPGDPTPYTMSRPLDSALVILSDVGPTVAAWVRSQPVEVIEREGAEVQALAAEFTGNAGFDDIILLAPRQAEEVAQAVDALAVGGTLTLVGNRTLDGVVSVDMGRLHYDNLAFLGCPGPDIAEAFGSGRNRSELRPDGVTLVVGAGGGMGRMHVQRALEMASGPRAVIATDRGATRLTHLQHTFGPLAQAQGREFVTLDPRTEPARLRQEIDRLTGGRGCDDIVIVVPSREAAEEAIPYLAADGMLVFFAGVNARTRVLLPLSNVPLHAAQFTGASGSTVADELCVLDKTAAGALSPGAVLAAIGGMQALNDSLRALLEGVYPGKIVIFPQLPGLPLISLPELAHVAPEVYACLGPNLLWTAAAEQALFERYLP